MLQGFNDLATVAPEVAAQWHPEKNKKRPDELLAGSHSKAWWICKDGHEWKSKIGSRALMGRGCPHCWKPWSAAEKEVFSYVTETINDMLVRENYRAPYLGNFELDIFVEDAKVAIEFNGEYWHDESSDPAIKDRHERKQALCDAHGIRLVIVWENDWDDRQKEVENQIVIIISGDSIPAWLTYERA